MLTSLKFNLNSAAFNLALASEAFFIESAEGILSGEELETYNFAEDRRESAKGWLPARRPLRVGVLAGASSPEIVVGQVVERLAELLG